MSSKRHQGFSLVELSIVLVILGLLTGGILAGQSLIRASELRAVGTEYNRYVTAAQAFRDKYFAMPGDFDSATKFWGRLNSNADCVTNSAAAVAASGGACDGNGNRLIQAGLASQSEEEYQFWLHLANAGLIEGTYSGLNGSGSIENTILGTNAPASKLNGAGWSMTSANTYGDAAMYTMDYGGNIFEFGLPVTNSRTYGKALKPEEAWNIDTKLDDGKPAYGKIIARYWNNACGTPDDMATFTSVNLASSYKLSDTSLQCALYFRNSL